MKKLWIVLSIFILSLVLVACSGGEYRVKVGTFDQEIPVDNYKVYYEVFVGAFSDSNNDGIGDLKGLINRLDYLNDGSKESGKSLGVEGLWLMPIMPANSYHKYDVRNYKAIDINYGTLEDFELLIQEADKRGISIVIDLVLNHTSDLHPWFKAAKTAIQTGDMTNPYIEYYSIVTSNQRLNGHTYYQLYGDYYYEGNFSSTMPELNMDSALVKAEIVDIIGFWFDLGVHGFRLDAAKYVYLNDTAKNIEFWNWFMEECYKIKEDAYVVGEVWSGDASILPYYEPFNNFDFGMSGVSGVISATANGQDSVNYFTTYVGNWRTQTKSKNPIAILHPFISNHDMNRAAGFLSIANHRMHMAANLYIWSSGNPYIYYGEEIGMKGFRGSENTDANRRTAMLWGDKDTVKDPVGTTYDVANQTNGTVKDQLNQKTSLLNHYKTLIMLRTQNPEIARGVYQPLVFQGYNTFGGFTATWNGSTVGVFHNTSEEPITINLANYRSQSFQSVRGYAGKGSASLSGQVLTLDGMTSVIVK
ncbi:MAG: alpha-amylase family glycosyl hydrolase [Candidatus Izemoplasmatales bacterium]|jgi:alpha-amylase|nr:alpha-amylase family glycosyl hydrolase [bacterium]MDZ4196777.1 alpha-amylase family glycosyl hydrolase [Candidatus Izemoplasmatales bacterium]